MAVVSDEPAGMVAVASGCDTPGRVSEHFAEGLCWRLRRRAIELSLVKIIGTKFKGLAPFLPLPGPDLCPLYTSVSPTVTWVGIGLLRIK